MKDFRDKLVVKEGARGTIRTKEEVETLLIVVEPDNILNHFDMSLGILTFVLATKALATSKN